jgi:hypothetical protein
MVSFRPMPFRNQRRDQRVQAHSFPFCTRNQPGMKASRDALSPLPAGTLRIRPRNVLTEFGKGSKTGFQRRSSVADSFFHRLAVGDAMGNIRIFHQISSAFVIR